MAVFFTDVKSGLDSKPEDSEAIASVVFLTEEELWMGLKNGWVKVLVKGQEQKLFLRDPFLTFALVQMQVRGLFFGVLRLNRSFFRCMAAQEQPGVYFFWLEIVS